jgi:hypothetical protein
MRVNNQVSVISGDFWSYLVAPTAPVTGGQGHVAAVEIPQVP